MIKLERISQKKLYALIIIASFFPFLSVALFKSELYTVMDISSYLVFHNTSEFFSVMVSLSIFGLGWYAYDQNRDKHALFLSVSFLTIGLIDFMHTLGYSGMPALITVNTPNKATEFWIVGRFLTAAVFLTSAFISYQSKNSWLSKISLMTAAIFTSSAVFIGIIFFPNYLPATFIQGVGLTPFKIVSEYVIIIMLVLASIIYWRRSSSNSDGLFHYYQAALILCIFSELAFTLYQSAFDTYNMLGHIYKIIAFFLIYKGVFVTSVRKPYEELTVLNQNLHEQTVLLETEMGEKECINDELQQKTAELEEEVEERQVAQQSLEEQTVMLEEEIAERARMQEEHNHLEEQLRQSQKMEAIGLLAGGVAHDFNNILTVIMGYCSLLNMKQNSEEEIQEAILRISSAAEKAAQLTGGLLAFSRKQVLDTKPVDLKDVVGQVQKFLVRIIGEDISLKTIFNDVGLHDSSLKVMADVGQIEQVLMNLATNARDAMPNGGTLTIETGQQELDESFVSVHGYGTPGLYAMIAVSDNGVGMDEETRKKIFEPFFTTKGVGKGTGLGMAIVYGIVNQHNGFVYVYSEPGKGTTFKIFIPMLRITEASYPAELTKEAPKGGTETLLVVEDNISVRMLVETFLINSGYEVITAENGEEAIKTFGANSDRIKLILMDIIMPKKSGMEVYKEIKPSLGNTKVLFMSGYTADFIRSKGELDEGTDLIMKPLNPTELLRKMREMLDR